jgi:ribosomal protein L7/L12
MRIAFFVSSLGDTDLAKSTISTLIEKKSTDAIFIIPLTSTAIDRIQDLKDNKVITIVSLQEITKQDDSLVKDKISKQEAETIKLFLDKNGIQHAYIGVPSSNNEIPYQLANELTISFTFAYEYMFKPEKHSFWSYVDKLASKENCDFAVPLAPAKTNILEINPKAKIQEIGHLSIDRSQTADVTDSTQIKKSLLATIEDQLIFISGTTQPTEVDNQFLDVLLNEITTGQYPNLQLRMGVHPGVKDPDSYLQALLNTCEKYSNAKDQFKIILTTQIEKRLQRPIPPTSFILRSEISGSDAAQAADKITQAVPGALLNEAALKGKPCYFHEKSAIPYLPKTWFSENLAAFFTAKPKASRSREELGLQDTAPNLLAKLMTK